MRRETVYRRRDGRWEARLYRERDTTERRTYRSFYGRTKAEAMQKIHAERCNAGHLCCSVRFSEITEEWLSTVQHRVKESTLANYRMKAEKHILPAFGDISVSNIRPEQICQFIRKKQAEGLSNRYISDILILMKSLFKFAVSRYHIRNPMDEVEMPKKSHSEVRLLSEEEQKKLESYIATHHNRTTLSIALAKATGLRIGELCALQWADIDLEKRILTVRKTIQRIQVKNGKQKTKLIITDPKSESSRRSIPIPAFLIPFLREFVTEPEDYVLSGNRKPIEPRTMQYRFARILKNGNLPSVHFHALRHMFATNCIQLGFDVKALSEILGHSGVEITLNRYVHSSFAQKTAYMDRLQMNI